MELLIEFTRALIRECPGSDALYLAMAAAADRADASDVELEALKSAVRQEQARGIWPAGFMP